MVARHWPDPQVIPLFENRRPGNRHSRANSRGRNLFQQSHHICCPGARSRGTIEAPAGFDTTGDGPFREKGTGRCNAYSSAFSADRKSPRAGRVKTSMQTMCRLWFPKPWNCLCQKPPGRKSAYLRRSTGGICRAAASRAKERSVIPGFPVRCDCSRLVSHRFQKGQKPSFVGPQPPRPRDLRRLRENLLQR